MPSTWPLDYIIQRNVEGEWVWHASVHDEDGYTTWLTKAENPDEYRLVARTDVSVTEKEEEEDDNGTTA